MSFIGAKWTGMLPKKHGKITPFGTPRVDRHMKICACLYMTLDFLPQDGKFRFARR
jgi:hypothetical protein